MRLPPQRHGHAAVTVFRKLIDSSRPGARIARTVFAGRDDASILFAKMLRGDFALQFDVARGFADVMSAIAQALSRPITSSEPV
jgi:hypothetical protein